MEKLNEYLQELQDEGIIDYSVKSQIKHLVNADIEENKHKSSYGVFCMAMGIVALRAIGRGRELDIVWDEAIELYEEFLQSPYPLQDYSELDCIADFLDNRKTNTI